MYFHSQGQNSMVLKQIFEIHKIFQIASQIVEWKISKQNSNLHVEYDIFTSKIEMQML